MTAFFKLNCYAFLLADVLTYAVFQFYEKILCSILKNEWFLNIRTDVLAGLVVDLALIPESIAFSAMAGIDPQVGLLLPSVLQSLSP